MTTLCRYVLVTPARNEARFIELTIESVVAQTVRPIKWVIVSDGSTDGTDEIVTKYATQHSWIDLVCMPKRYQRDFASKVFAFNAGYAQVKDLDHQAIGSMDGDVSFGEDYFSFLLDKLTEGPRLGIVGTPFKESSGKVYDYRFASLEHVSGICQLFRRKCFEEIGGYLPIKRGGIDLNAVIAARMQGWKTRTFTERICIHHRPIGTAGHHVLTAKFKQGTKDYAFGGHPVWELFRTAYQVTQSPVIVGGLSLGAGYFWAMARRVERSIPCEMLAFRRREQMQRLRKFVRTRLLSAVKRKTSIATGCLDDDEDHD